MNHLRVCEILLLSEREQKARKIEFHPQATVLTGDNGSGKSSVIKAIFQTIGAEPAKVSAEWKSANVSSLLKCDIGGEIYYFFRRRQLYAVFDREGELIQSFSSVVKGIGPYFADLVDFRISLLTKQDEEIVPPPAFFLLPFYVDQDKSWESTWSGFANLGFVKDYKRQMAEYHTGIRPNRYYELSAKRTSLKTKISKAEGEIAVMNGVLGRLRKQFSNSEFDIDTAAFEAEIDRLVHESQALLKAENELKGQLAENGNYRNELLNQRQIIQRTLSDLQADYEFAANSTAQVECPTCGQEYENSFPERFALAKDQDRLVEFLSDIETELSRTEKQISGVRAKFRDNQKSADVIAALLETKKEQVTLATVTLNVGRRQAAEELHAAVQEQEKVLADLLIDLRRVEEELKSLDDKAHKKEIVSYYGNALQGFLYRLNVSNVSPDVFKQVTADLAKVGSEKPRAMLAYFFAILHTVHRFSTAVFCPIVVDSPQQQEQDKNNLLAMLELIRDNRPKDSQLLLAVVDDMGVEFGGRRLDFGTSKGLLQQSEYEIVQQQMAPYIEKALTTLLRPGTP